MKNSFNILDIKATYIIKNIVYSFLCVSLLINLFVFKIDNNYSNYNSGKNLLALSFKSCKDHIDDYYNVLSYSEYNNICTLLSNFNENIYIRITDDAPHQGMHYDYYYDNDSSSYFNSKCKIVNNRYDSNNCSNSILISIYKNARKIRLTVGNQIDKVVNHYSRLHIVDKMKPFLSNHDYGAGISIALNQLKYYLPYSHIEVQNYQNHQNNNHSSGGGVFLTLMMFLCCICCYVGCFYLFNKKKEDEAVINESELMIRHDDSKNLELVPDNIIHMHLQRLLDIVKYKIKSNSCPIVQIEQCPICMELINPEYEIDEKKGSTNSNLYITKFNCNHYFHSACLSNKNVGICLFCNDITTQIPCESNFRYYNIVSEDNIFNVIKRFDLLYSRSNLNSYSNKYKEDRVIIREVYPTYFNSGSTFIWIDCGSNYHNNYYENNNYYPPDNNNNNYNYNTTSGGDYGNYNNNNDYNTSGGNFGENNDGGDY